MRMPVRGTNTGSLRGEEGGKHEQEAARRSLPSAEGFACWTGGRPTPGTMWCGALRWRRRRASSLGSWYAALVLLSSSTHIHAFEAETCTGNCSAPAHICGLVPANSWLMDYVPSIVKVCRCENYTMAGRRCDTPCPHGHSNPCNGHGECLYSSATCACDFGWQGV